MCTNLESKKLKREGYSQQWRKSEYENNGIPERISETRNEKNWSMDYLAKRAGLARNSIFNYENSLTVPDIVALTHIANALGVSLVYLITGEKPNTESRYLAKEVLYGIQKSVTSIIEEYNSMIE